MLDENFAFHWGDPRYLGKHFTARDAVAKGLYGSDDMRVIADLPLNSN
jgi:hypothetical protein